MALINCPECGKQVSDKAPACPDCGCPINAAPSVSAPNNAEEVDKLLVLARRAREGGDTVNAKRYYDQILDKAPGNWEGIFYSVYYDATMCKIMNIASAANSVANCIFSTFSAISDLNDDNEKEDALYDVVASATSIAESFIQSAERHYYGNSTVDGVRAECAGRISAAHNIYREVEASFKKVFPERKELLADFQLQFINFLNKHSHWLSTNAISRLQKEIAIVRPEYGKRLELTKEIEDLNSKITELEKPGPVNKKEAAQASIRVFGIAIVLLTIGIVSFCWGITDDIGILGGILAGFLLVMGLGLAAVGVSFLRDIKKAPTEEEEKIQNQKKAEEKEELIQKRDALQKELNNTSI